LGFETSDVFFVHVVQDLRAAVDQPAPSEAPLRVDGSTAARGP